MRQYFVSQLKQINQDIIDIAALSEQAISKLIIAINNKDVQLAKGLVNDEQSISSISRQTESKCLHLILAQQPVASDFRYLSATIKILYDFQRIANMVADISEIIVYIAHENYKNSKYINQMAEQSIVMLKTSINAFINMDMELAKKLDKDDDIIDELFVEFKQELEKKIQKGSSNISAVLDKLMIAKYFERIGDHAVNIGLWVEYAITGLYKGEKL